MAGLRKGPYVERVLPSSGRSLDRATRLAHKAGLPKSGAIWQNRKIFFQIMEGDPMDRLEAMSTFLTVVEQGSLSAATRRSKNAAHNNQPERIRARVSPADETLQPIEPAAGANGCRRFLRCGLQAHSH